ncbi:MAG: hypothetical protein JJU29_17815 [Verrucomicrobia bacterium]|nr:hypothetical protein [Verrucomicrobiota bacterium]MCH8513873.1 hypothetical protein [Kiritimatiellia bacterium]
MRLETKDQKIVRGLVGDAKTPVNISQNRDKEEMMTRMEIYDQPKTPPLQGGGVCWFVQGAAFLGVLKSMEGVR